MIAVRRGRCKREDQTRRPKRRDALRVSMGSLSRMFLRRAKIFASLSRLVKISSLRRCSVQPIKGRTSRSTCLMGRDLDYFASRNADLRMTLRFCGIVRHHNVSSQQRFIETSCMMTNASGVLSLMESCDSSRMRNLGFSESAGQSADCGKILND